MGASEASASDECSGLGSTVKGVGLLRVHAVGDFHSSSRNPRSPNPNFEAFLLARILSN